MCPVYEEDLEEERHLIVSKNYIDRFDRNYPIKIEDTSMRNTEIDKIHRSWDICERILPSVDEYDAFQQWPDGHCKYVYSASDAVEAGRHMSGWAMRNTNNHNALVLKKSCLGVLVCSRSCLGPDNRILVNFRPAICDKARAKQIGRQCPTSGCGGHLVLKACEGHGGYPVTHFWRTSGSAIFFQSKGVHSHPRPVKFWPMIERRQKTANEQTKKSQLLKKRKVTQKRNVEPIKKQKIHEHHPVEQQVKMVNRSCKFSNNSAVSTASRQHGCFSGVTSQFSFLTSSPSSSPSACSSLESSYGYYQSGSSCSLKTEVEYIKQQEWNASYSNSYGNYWPTPEPDERTSHPMVMDDLPSTPVPPSGSTWPFKDDLVCDYVAPFYYCKQELSPSQHLNYELQMSEPIGHAIYDYYPLNDNSNRVYADWGGGRQNFYQSCSVDFSALLSPSTYEVDNAAWPILLDAINLEAPLNELDADQVAEEFQNISKPPMEMFDHNNVQPFTTFNAMYNCLSRRELYDRP